MFKWEVKTHQAQNAIYIEKEVEGKGRFFRARFLQAGLVNYSFGVCLLNQESIMKFAHSFVGCPVVIDHKDVTEESAKDDRVGVISKVDFDNYDGWFWCEGIIFDDKAIELVNNGYNVSCQYEITEYAKNIDGKLHNGNKYDIEILNGRPEHLAIVENPRYENAMIAVNAICSNEEKENPINNSILENIYNLLKAKNEGRWITVKPNGDDAKGRHLYLQDGETPKEAMQRQWGVYEKRQADEKAVSPVEKPQGIPQDKPRQNPDYTPPKKDDDGGEFERIMKELEEKKKKENGRLNEILNKELPDLRDKLHAARYKRVKARESGANTKFLDKQIEELENKETQLKEEMLSLREEREKYIKENQPKYSTSEEFREKIKKSNVDIDWKQWLKEHAKENKSKNNKDVDTLKGANKMETTNGILEKIFNLLAKNEADKKEDKEAENKCKNEDTDKRKLIDEVGGILKGKVDEEVWRTIIGKIEKVAYSESEAGTADNKAKNEDDEDDKECDKKADNKCKNEDSEKEEKFKEMKEEIKKDIENEKAKNSLDEARKKIFGGKVEKVSTHITQKQALELGKKLY